MSKVALHIFPFWTPHFLIWLHILVGFHASIILCFSGKVHFRTSDFRPYLQWRRQRSKGARSFQGQNILEQGHPEKSWQPFLLSPSKHKGRQHRWDCFTVKIKQIKRSAGRYR